MRRRNSLCPRPRRAGTADPAEITRRVSLSLDRALPKRETAMCSFHRNSDPAAYTLLIILCLLLYVPVQGFTTLAGDVPRWLRGTVGAVYTLIAVWNVVQPQVGRFSAKERWIAACVQGASLILFWTMYVLDKTPFIVTYCLSFIIAGGLQVLAHFLVDNFRAVPHATGCKGYN